MSNGTNLFQTDYNGGSVRPTVMHDSKPGDPMWFVQDDSNGTQIDVVKMANELSNAAVFTTSHLSVTPFAEINADTSGGPYQPNGTQPTTHLDSRILKAAEAGGMLVATQAVSNNTASAVTGNGWDRDLARWYEIDVSSGNPAILNQGNVASAATGAGQANVYDYFPGIDINPAGDIGMSFMQSSYTAPNTGQFMSMWVTGRAPSDPPAPWKRRSWSPPARASDYTDFDPPTHRAGDMSGINVDANGSSGRSTNPPTTKPAGPTGPGRRQLYGGPGARPLNVLVLTGAALEVDSSKVGGSMTINNKALFLNGSGTSEIQTVSIGAASGTFALTYGANTTPNLAYNAPASLVQSQLNLLPSISGPGGAVTVALTGSVYVITFGGAFAGTNVGTLSAAGMPIRPWRPITRAAPGPCATSAATTPGPARSARSRCKAPAPSAPTPIRP